MIIMIRSPSLPSPSPPSNLLPSFPLDEEKRWELYAWEKDAAPVPSPLRTESLSGKISVIWTRTSFSIILTAIEK